MNSFPGNWLVSLHFQATAEANNLAAVAGAKEVYANLMEDVCGGAKPYLGAGHLEAEHLRIKDKAIFQVRLWRHGWVEWNWFRCFSFHCSLHRSGKWVAKSFRKNIWNNWALTWTTNSINSKRTMKAKIYSRQHVRQPCSSPSQLPCTFWAASSACSACTRSPISAIWLWALRCWHSRCGRTSGKCNHSCVCESLE